MKKLIVAGMLALSVAPLTAFAADRPARPEREARPVVTAPARPEREVRADRPARPEREVRPERPAR